MTFLEKAMQMQSKPTASKEAMVDEWCPHHLKLEPFNGGKCDSNCEACWNREMPEENLFPNEAGNTGIAIGEVAIPLGRDEITELHEIVEKALTDESPHILDSGARRQFETGAVRDIQEGKGRCDLLPLDVVGFYYAGHEDLSIDDGPQAWVFYHLTRFKEDGMITHLFNAIHVSKIFPDTETMFLEVAKHFEEGCKKYGENNWQKGIPVRCYIDSAVRHYLKFLRGDKDEPHDRAFCWNLMCAIWTCKHKPELNDYAKGEVNA